jgi:hypothetical protein
MDQQQQKYSKTLSVKTHPTSTSKLIAEDLNNCCIQTDLKYSYLKFRNAYVITNFELPQVQANVFTLGLSPVKKLINKVLKIAPLYYSTNYKNKRPYLMNCGKVYSLDYMCKVLQDHIHELHLASKRRGVELTEEERQAMKTSCVSLLFAKVAEPGGAFFGFIIYSTFRAELTKMLSLSDLSFIVSEETETTSTKTINKSEVASLNSFVDKFSGAKIRR